jgi:hypothetical protein
MLDDERIIARRVTLEEFSDYIGGLDYLRGRILTRSGIELFVGVKEFAESTGILEKEGDVTQTNLLPGMD